MHIIAHRGEWTNPQLRQPPNSVESFCLALEHGFGIEVDIRDKNKNLIISHNPPQADAPLLTDVLNFYFSHQCQSLIAFNIKADGLQNLLIRVLERYHIQNYFTFDMSIPNTLNDKEAQLNYFLRQSEYETAPQTLQDLYTYAKGIWLDQFSYSAPLLEHHLQSIASYVSQQKSVCVVSPELHPWGKTLYLAVWHQLKHILHTLPAEQTALVSLCTDYPTQARRFFCEGN